ncbi:putative phd-finger domain-containing protein [Golovinomyces cichoracearum]|uniref:Putative phd-finger domain-containing protein n=1 Tax=Golovinomyces cichoracearum TaxID=62708 RepID=A0A420I9Q8_9PEZI|nr:putative phd-finger domain-containing protein [Golovinomyces cichoracearum]
MTERPLSATTQPAISNSLSVNDAPQLIESATDEPYTIKCICDYYDDDGNTIYCEKCDTWQHIECFYPGRVDDASKEEFDHSCAECKPRPLDRRHATERQRHQRQNKSSNNLGEKKIKRLPSKGYKRKSKPLEVQANGFHDLDSHRNGSHEHQLSSKKTKSNRSSLSTTSQCKKSPSLNSRPEQNTQHPSPIHTPPYLPTNFQVHGYSENFLTLYNQVPIHSTSTNSFASLSVSNSMTDWLRDPSRLFQDAGVRDKEDVFLNLKVSVDSLKWPELRVEKKEEVFHNTTLHWQYLITPCQLPQPGRIVELNGLVGFQKDYCSDPENRWIESAHPRPFVFFHPRLPLCIDARREGSIGRYVRRSCQSNTSLETFIANGTEYHFWLTSEQPLSANEQITISWDFRFPPQYRARFLHLLNLGDEIGSPLENSDITHEEYEQLTQTIHLVLSDHGGCACDLSNDCAFARFHRNYLQNSHFQINEIKPKKARKTKLPQNLSISNDIATANRVTTDYQQKQYDNDDNQSVSGSIPSKPHSRDLTPANTNNDNNFFLTEPSDREKRKLAMLEDSFRKMEQGQPIRKKKKASDNSSTNSPAQSISKQRQRSINVSGLPSGQASHSSSRLRPVDTNTPRLQLGSPASILSPSNNMPPPSNTISRIESPTYCSKKSTPSQKLQYKDSFTQTDDVKNAWWTKLKTKNKKSVVSLARRLLLNRYRKTHENKKRDSIHFVDHENLPIDMVVPESGGANQAHEIEPSECTSDLDKPSLLSSIVDVSSCDSPSKATTFSRFTNTSPIWPNQTNTISFKPENTYIDASPDSGAPRFTPAFSLSNSYTLYTNPVSPLAVLGSSVSAFGTSNHNSLPLVNGINHESSPLKTTKKLSLSDYKAARMKKVDPPVIIPNNSMGEKSPELNHTAFKPPSITDVNESRTSVTFIRSVKRDALSGSQTNSTNASLRPLGTEYTNPAS